MICGNCKQHHLSVAEVRECYGRHEDERKAIVVVSDADPAPGAQAQPQLFRTLAEPGGARVATAQPEAQIRQRPAEAAEGFYSVAGKIYKVQRAIHGSGRLYAKRLLPPNSIDERGEWQYEPGAVRWLAVHPPMTMEQAIAFGKLYGICAICGATLTNEESIDRGIGPICASKMGW